MKIKQLLRHTTILLRTALLLGAIAFVNVQRTEAQTAEQLAAMPNAFETMDPASIIGDGQYYYIQFYDDGTLRSYLTDCGIEKKALTKDFLPSNNRLWTLEKVNDTQFRLKSKSGHYLGLARFENASGDRYGCVDNINNAVTLTFHQNGDGYDLSPASNQSVVMYRVAGKEWVDDLANEDHSNHTVPVARLRFVRLKSNAK